MVRLRKSIVKERLKISEIAYFQSDLLKANYDKDVSINFV